MYYDNFTLIPGEGIAKIKLGMKFDEVIKILKDDGIIYSTAIDANKGCTPQKEWETIFVKDYMSFCFVEKILWQINAKSNYKGKLKNGISIGDTIQYAKILDPKLEYDDWNEYFKSPEGYWLFDTIKSGNKIYMITINLLECMDDETFYSYEWLNKFHKKT
jgi:hypothetical protein